MDAKQLISIILIILGITGLLYTGIQVMNADTNLRALIVIGILGIIFFSSGIRLMYSVRK